LILSIGRLALPGVRGLAGLAGEASLVLQSDEQRLQPLREVDSDAGTPCPLLLPGSAAPGVPEGFLGLDKEV